ncbi:LCP family protein [Streptomyces xiaopingdaonensis]|uniref:LCP family protein n=1 Tax=Streptomyces xiaopingdaonensis TaxID=1565415 RepID=UPI00030F7643|nr:LCP family protein [Streptomyces xiaopingdaonensis]
MTEPGPHDAATPGDIPGVAPSSADTAEDGGVAAGDGQPTGAEGKERDDVPGEESAAPEAEDAPPADEPEPDSPEPEPPESEPAPDANSLPRHASPPATADEEHPPDGAQNQAEPPPKRRRWLRRTAIGLSLLLLAAAATGWTFYRRLDGNIRTDTDTARELAEHEEERPEPRPGPALNILLLGSDSRAGDNGDYGRDEGAARADTTILLHIAGDRKSATGVSLPRDLVVDIPACTGPDGSATRAQFAQFNWAFQYGGPACTIRTVEKLTGMRVDHHAVVDFQGFKGLVDAVGGVEICLAEPVHDTDARLDLPEGRQTLEGEDALGYVRARHGIGDGSDTERMARQQVFLGSLVKKIRSSEVLLNPTRLYPLLDAATSSLTADDGLDSLGDLYGLARDVQSLPASEVRFLTVPRQPYGPDPNRDELSRPAADRLFAQLDEDQPVRVTGESEGGKEEGEESSEPPASLDPSELSEPPARSDSSETGNAQGNGGDSAKDSTVRRPGDPAGTPDPAGSPQHEGGDGDSEEAEGPSYRGTTAAHDVCSANDAVNEAN